MPFISTRNISWKHLLKHAPTDIYHLPSYAEMLAEHVSGEALAWYFKLDDKTCIIPLIKRKINYNDTGIPVSYMYDLQSPYGYPGILSDITILPEEIDRLLENYQQEASAAGYVSSFIRLNPFLNNWNIRKTDNLEQKFPGDIVVLQLKDAKNPVISKNHLRNLKRLKESGFSTCINDNRFSSEFINYYRLSMLRRKSEKFYLFESDYFSKLLSISKGHSYFITVLSPEGEFAAAGIFTLFGNIMHYQYGVTKEKFRFLSPFKLVIFAAIETGRNSGATFLNLGGGYKASNDNSLFRFKKGFDKKGVLYKFSSLQIIHQPIIYNRIPKISTNYFPSYRYD